MQAKTTTLIPYLFFHAMLLSLAVSAEVEPSFVDDNKAAVLEAKLKDLTSEGVGGNWYQYGHKIRVDGHQALVHSEYAAEIFVLTYDGTAWTESEVIELPHLLSSDDDLEISGDYIFISDSSERKIELYQHINGAWIHSAELVPSQTEDPINFGRSISASENVLVVGTGGSSGEAYVFELNQGIWSETDILLPTNNNRSGFASEAKVYGNKILLTSSDGIYYFKGENNGWNEKQLITLPANISYYYDNQLALSDNHLAIGLPHQDVAGILNSGMVLTYHFNGTVWEFERTLSPATEEINARYGLDLSLVDDNLIVGSAGHLSSNSEKEGVVYLYQFDAIYGWELSNSFMAPDGFVNNAFGYSLGLSTDQALIGAFNDTGVAFKSGAVYVAKKNGNFWAINQKQQPSISTRLNDMGQAVAVSGDTVLLGAPNQSSAIHGAHSGAAIFFQRQDQNWVQSTQLVAGDSIHNNFFGSVVCFEDNLAVISADTHSDSATATGAVYVFEKTNGMWSQSVKLTNNNGQVFGRSCDIFANSFIIGYHNQFDSKGGASIYEKVNGQWQVMADLNANDGQLGDYFGDAVALGNDLAFVGAKYEHTENPFRGAVYAFENIAGTWQQTNKIRANDPIEYDYFGSSISLSGNQLLVGTTRGGANAVQRTGTAYLFEQSGNQWLQTKHFIPNDVPAGNEIYFGNSVSLNDNRVAIGSIFSGVYVYELTNGLWILVDRLWSDYTLTNSSHAEFNQVSIDGGLLVYGSPRDNELFYGSGAAYVHNYTIYPSGINDEFEVLEDTVAVMLDVLSNDHDSEDGVIESVTQPSNGQVSISNNQILYTPNADFCNYGQVTDQFNYALNGGSSAQVEVDVICVNDRPSFSHLGNQTTQFIGQQSIPNWAYDLKVGPENEVQNQTIEEFEVNVISDPDNVLNTLSMDLNGDLYFTTSGQSGTATIRIKMLDDGGTNNGGHNWSIEHEFTLTFNDTIFSNGFE